jgi:hypothetical protein
MQISGIDGSVEIKVPIDPSVRLRKSDCPTQEEIEANPATHKQRTKFYQQIMGGCIFINNVQWYLIWLVISYFLYFPGIIYYDIIGFFVFLIYPTGCLLVEI